MYESNQIQQSSISFLKICIKLFLIGFVGIILLSLFSQILFKESMTNNTDSNNLPFNDILFGLFFGSVSVKNIFLTIIWILLIFMICFNSFFITILILIIGFNTIEKKIRKSNSIFVYFSYLYLISVIFLPIISLTILFSIFPIITLKLLNIFIEELELIESIIQIFDVFYGNQGNFKQIFKIVLCLVCMFLNLKIFNYLLDYRTNNSEKVFSYFPFFLLLILEPISLTVISQFLIVSL